MTASSTASSCRSNSRATAANSSLRRPVEPDPGEAAAVAARLVHRDEVDGLRDAAPVAVDGSIDDHQKWPLIAVAGDAAFVGEAGTQDQHLGGARSSSHRGRRRTGRAGVAGGGDDHAVDGLLLEQQRERVAVGAAAADAGVDRDIGAGGGLLDRFEQWHPDGAGRGTAALEREVARDGGQEGGDERRVLGAREPQRGVERAARDRRTGEGQQDRARTEPAPRFWRARRWRA